MNQTICCSSKADRTIYLLNYKDEEKQLSESLFRNLHVMMRFHEPSKEFLDILEPLMFIKTNSRAFPHVIHFIFNSLDATEFNKKFRWPIADKASETQFRKTTVDYMNHLNATYQLGLETLRLSNIYIPRGIKFIKIIHRFTYLIMKEELKKSRHWALPNFKEIPNANEQFKKREKFLDEGFDFVTRLEAQSDILSNQIDGMNGLIELLFENCDTTEQKMKRCWTCYAGEWREKLDSDMENEVKPCLQRVNAFTKEIGRLNKQLSDLCVAPKENFVQYDKGKLNVAQDNIKKLKPILKDVVDGIIENSFINFDNLLSVFEFSLPKIMNKIETYNGRNFDTLRFEYAGIKSLDKNSTTVEHKLNDIEMSLKPFLEKDEANFNKFCMINSVLPFRLLQTPQMSRRSDPDRNNHRISSTNGSGSVKFKEPMPPMIRNVKKPNTSNRTISAGESSSHRLTSMNASLLILSRKKSNASFNTCATSTPIPSMNKPVDQIRNTHQISLFPMLPVTPKRTLPTTKPENVVDRFIHSDITVYNRSPSRRFPLIDTN